MRWLQPSLDVLVEARRNNHLKREVKLAVPQEAAGYRYNVSFNKKKIDCTVLESSGLGANAD